MKKPDLRKTYKNLMKNFGRNYAKLMRNLRQRYLMKT